MQNKYHKTSMVILGILVACVTVFDAALTYWAPEFVRRFTYINWFFLVFAIFTVFSPLGRVRLGDETPEHSTFKWILQTFGLQIFSVMMFINLLQVAYLYFPYDFAYATYTPPSAPQLLHLFFINWGLFPWPLLALMGILLGILFYNKGRPAILSLYFPTLKNSYYTLFFRRVINGFFIVETNFAFTVSLVLLILVINLLLVKLLGQFDPVVVRTGDYLFIILASVLYITKTSPKLIAYIVKRTRMISLAFSAFAVLIAITLTIAHLLSHWLFNEVNFSTRIAQTLSHTFKMNWTILFWGFWVCWTPFLASVIAKISKGRKGYQIIIVNLILPIISLILIHFKVNLHIDWHGIFYNPLFALITPMFILVFLHREHGIDHLLFGMMPQRNDAVALPLRTTHNTETLMRISLALVITFILHNMFAIQFLMSLIALPNIVFFVFACLAAYTKQ